MDECVFECLWGQWGPSGYIMRKSRNCQLTWVPIRKVYEHDIYCRYGCLMTHACKSVKDNQKWIGMGDIQTQKHFMCTCLICISSPPGATHVAVHQYHDLFLWRWLMMSIVALVFQRVVPPRDQVVSPFTVPRLQARKVRTLVL